LILLAYFVTADEKFRKVVEEEGIVVLNPGEEMVTTQVVA